MLFSLHVICLYIQNHPAGERADRQTDSRELLEPSIIHLPLVPPGDRHLSFTSQTQNEHQSEAKDGPSLRNQSGLSRRLRENLR